MLMAIFLVHKVNSFQFFYQSRVKQFFENEIDDSLDSIAIVAHQVVIRCCFVYLGYDC
jgi:broad specificity phosphatase PhoE